MGAEAEPAEAAPAERPEAEGPAGAGEEPGAAAEDPAENRARLQALVAKGERLSKEELREAQALIKAVEDLGAVGLEAPKRPSLPAKLEKLSASGRMRACQGFISAFQVSTTRGGACRGGRGLTGSESTTTRARTTSTSARSGRLPG